MSELLVPGLLGLDATFFSTQDHAAAPSLRLVSFFGCHHLYKMLKDGAVTKSKLDNFY